MKRHSNVNFVSRNELRASIFYEHKECDCFSCQWWHGFESSPSFTQAADGLKPNKTIFTHICPEWQCPVSSRCFVPSVHTNENASCRTIHLPQLTVPSQHRWSGVVFTHTPSISSSSPLFSLLISHLIQSFCLFFLPAFHISYVHSPLLFILQVRHALIQLRNHTKSMQLQHDSVFNPRYCMLWWICELKAPWNIKLKVYVLWFDICVFKFLSQSLVWSEIYSRPITALWTNTLARKYKIDSQI